jgi:hypothetical protein
MKRQLWGFGVRVLSYHRGSMANRLNRERDRSSNRLRGGE